MTTTTVTVTLSLPTAAPTPKEVGNAVRRATEALTQNNAVLVPGAPVEAKGVTVRTRTLKGVTKTYSPIRTWAVENGHPEVEGKRGRLSKTLIAEYEAATKGGK